MTRTLTTKVLNGTHVTQTQPNYMYWQKKSAYILKRVEAFDYAGNDVAPPAKNLNYPTK